MFLSDAQTICIISSQLDVGLTALVVGFAGFMGWKTGV